MNTYVISIILIMALITFFTRLSPFLFGQSLKDKPFINFLGQNLPLMIMPILVISSLPKEAFEKGLNFKEELLGVLGTLVLHIIFQRPLVSIFGGTFIYIISLQIL